MKKIIVVMLALAFFAAQGIACAEDVVADVQAQADDMVVEDTFDVEDFITDEGDEMMLVEETEEVVPFEDEDQI